MADSSQEDLIAKVIELESYVQTLEKVNESKNSELSLLRKKVQLLKDQNLVLKVQSKNPYPDKYLSMEAMIIELQEKLESAMQQCVYFRAENQKLKRRLQLQNKNHCQQSRLSVKRGSNPPGIPASPTKLSYPVPILKNGEKGKDQNILNPSMKFNTAQRKSSYKGETKYSSNKCPSKNDRVIEDSLEYSKQQSSSIDVENICTDPRRVFAMDGNVSFSNLHNEGKRIKNSSNNSSAQRQRLRTDSNRNFLFSDGECEALGKIIDQLRDGQRRIRRHY